ncbi:MAG: hypothetical protein A2826_02055 [Candidatus Doudnabacteria bacterium RIFCSPHIGHO2_01_FULL_43_23]|uniref:CMP/dCMP-type deaminase domain-containing protein n=1 Tax=Candidatus Doudnabacteria bacterium RIFCSPHIGHO2_01_FULL_43_23 TaxID=1817822 RepID=A0A1F5NUH6_9BACT|nr:MAG: hypothetical protein A2826_02055 [Candidatus Doudnabacteria bacterium RIFCSPHIGHO2_01_FULL_43_23]
MDALHLAAFRKRRHWLIMRAIKSCETDARQYRGFHVGCAVLGWDKTHGYRMFSAGNRKPENHAKRECAERRALEKAKIAGIARVIAIVVYGPNQDDDFTRIHRSVLHPCGFCRRIASLHLDDGGPIYKDTIYVGVSTEGALEQLTYQDIMEIHGVPTLPQLITKRVAQDGCTVVHALSELQSLDPWRMLDFRNTSGLDEKTLEEAWTEWLADFEVKQPTRLDPL